MIVVIQSAKYTHRTNIQLSYPANFKRVSVKRGAGVFIFPNFFYHLIFDTFNSIWSIYQSVSCVRTDEYLIVRERSKNSVNKKHIIII